MYRNNDIDDEKNTEEENISFREEEEYPYAQINDTACASCPYMNYTIQQEPYQYYQMDQFSDMYSGSDEESDMYRFPRPNYNPFFNPYFMQYHHHHHRPFFHPYYHPYYHPFYPPYSMHREW